MPSTAPETSASTAVNRNGTSTHTGRMLASAPIGSAAIATMSSSSDPASSRPKTTRMTGATEPPMVFQATIAPSDAVRFW